MTTRTFEIVEPSSVEAALRYIVAGRRRARPMAGGIDILYLLKQKAFSKSDDPKTLIDLSHISELRFLLEGKGGLGIGAMTTLSELEESSVVNGRYRILAQAARTIATPQIRNMSTVGGNICQDVWCWYYRASGNAFNCLRKGGRNCPPIWRLEGEHKWMYSVFGGIGGCVAVHPSDLAPALAALDAEVNITEDGGMKTLPIIDFIRLYVVGRADYPWLLRKVFVPRPSPHSRSAFIKFAFRKAIDFAIASVSTQLCFDGSVCTKARVVLGGVYLTPYRCLSAERMLENTRIDAELIEKVANVAVRKAVPLPMNRYKVWIARALLKRALLDSLEGHALTI